MNNGMKWGGFTVQHDEADTNKFFFYIWVGFFQKKMTSENEMDFEWDMYHAKVLCNQSKNYN